VSPLLCNLFLHYAFDAWMGRTYPTIQFERYADDSAPRRRGKEAEQAA
jgi:retron-type reverse transcriptase